MGNPPRGGILLFVPSWPRSTGAQHAGWIIIENDQSLPASLYGSAHPHMGHTHTLAQDSSPDDHHFHGDNDNDDNGFDDNINDDNDNGGDGENDCTDENLKKAGRHSPLLA